MVQLRLYSYVVAQLHSVAAQIQNGTEKDQTCAPGRTWRGWCDRATPTAHSDSWLSLSRLAARGCLAVNAMHDVSALRRDQ